ncbi:MAG: M16 family metallopeptidase [Candidatus Cyclobacteriaceae bacterium M2_1C_046]
MLDRTIAPAFVKTPEVKLKEAEHNLIHNIPFHYVTGGSQEVIKIEFVFNAGKWYESKNGASYFTVNSLREGTETYTSKEISALLDHYGAYLELSSGFDYSSVGLYCLNKYLPEVLPVLAEMIYKPAFPEDQLELLKEIELQRLKIDLKKTRFNAQRYFRESLFTNNVSYGQHIDSKDIESISRVDIENHFNTNYSNFEIFASGNFDTDEIQDVLGRYFSKGNKLDISDDRTLSDSLYKATTLTEDVEGSMQSSLRMGFPFVTKVHEDYIPFKILNHLLGGYFGSRLMKNIREDKGYTYGINSGIIPLKFSSYFIVATDVVKASSNDAIDEIKKELKQLKEEIIPLDELETVKNHLVGSFQSDITSPFSLLDKYKSLYLHNLNYSYYEKYFDKLNEITPEELQQLAQKYFIEDKLTIIKVG